MSNAITKALISQLSALALVASAAGGSIQAHTSSGRAPSQTNRSFGQLVITAKTAPLKSPLTVSETTINRLNRAFSESVASDALNRFSDQSNRQIPPASATRLAVNLTAA